MKKDNLRNIMKYTVLAIILLATVFNAAGQTIPKTFNYQAVARTDEGYPIADKPIVVEISILQGAWCDQGGSCNTIWQEIHNPTTNEFGLFAIEIGAGQSTFQGSAAAFTDIDWNAVNIGNEYFVKIRVDFGDAEFINGLLDMGTSKFQSVPYSLVAQYAQNIAKDLNGKVALNLGDLNDVTISSVTNDQVLKYDNATSKWINSSVTTQSGASSLSQLLDVSISGLSANQILSWNGAYWINQAPASIDLTGYIKKDGTTDLTGDWTISGNSISLTGGSLFLGSGSINLTNGSVTLTNGRVTTKEFRIGIGQMINEISTDGTFASNSDLILPTQKAIKTYITSVIPSGNGWTIGTGTVYNLNDNIGVGTNSPLTKFHVSTGATSAGFLISGTYNQGLTIPSNGAGTWMMFYPSRAAFRAGTVTGTEWSNGSVGIYSVAFGYNTKATTPYSFAGGNASQATGDYSFAFGQNTTASDVNAVAFGKSNNASGGRSFSVGQFNFSVGVGSATFGDNNTANGLASTCFGTGNKAGSTTTTGNYSIAMGDKTQTDGNASFSGGYKAMAFGHYSLAFGDSVKTDVTGKGQFACGGWTNASGIYSAAFGFNSFAGAYGSVAMGRYNTKIGNASTWLGNDPILILGMGTSDVARADAFIIYQNGNGWMAGSLTQASDENLKKDIEPISNIIDKIIELKPVNYYWDNTVPAASGLSNTLQTGLIAQDVEKIFPELVQDNPNGYKSINYTGFVPLLIQTVKEQQSEIDALSKKLNDLEQRLLKLEQK